MLPPPGSGTILESKLRCLVRVVSAVLSTKVWWLWLWWLHQFVAVWSSRLLCQAKSMSCWTETGIGRNTLQATGSGSLYLRGSVCRCVCKSRSSSAAWSRPSPRAQSKRLML